MRVRLVVCMREVDWIGSSTEFSVSGYNRREEKKESDIVTILPREAWQGAPSWSYWPLKWHYHFSNCRDFGVRDQGWQPSTGPSFYAAVEDEMQRLFRAGSEATGSTGCCAEFCVTAKNGLHLAGVRTAAAEPDRRRDDLYGNIMFKNVIAVLCQWESI